MSCKKVLYFLLSLLLCPDFGFGQNNTIIKINNYTVPFSSDPASWSNTTSVPRLVLIRFKDLLSIEEKNTLASEQIKILDYIGSVTYSALIGPSAHPGNHPSITGIATFDGKYKMTASILGQSEHAPKVKALVRFINGLEAAEINSLVSATGAVILPGGWQKKGLYTIEIPSVRLFEFASFYGVDFISEPSRNKPLDLDSKGGEGASLLNMPTALGGKGLRGKGVFIGHGDECSGIYHIDQSDRVINYNPAGASEHGVLVNGIMAGEGIMDPAGQGVATEGTCISLFFDAVLQQKEELYKGFNATLTNNSYAAIVGSCDYSGLYDNLSREMDELAFTIPEQLDVFAAGNDGGLVCGAYPAGYYNVVGGYQTAKNVLTVGSTFRDYKISATSGRGPVRDGRVKPEICAVGATIYCPIPVNTYRIQSGTSLSCPQVTGILALLTERYRQLNSGANPRSDLLKAIAINGASDFGKPGPDFWYGFGFINAVRSLDIIEKSGYERNSIASGDPARSFTVNVPANTAQLKVLLYYHDPAANPAATTQLVNDLDLTVTEPGGSIVHRPLVLNSAAVSVGNNAVEGVDRLNNAEQVVINNPGAGTYSISVSGFAIPEGPQDYVVVYDFLPKEAKLLFPFANAAASAGSDMYIYWDAPADAAATSIRFSPDSGATWSPVATVDPGIRTFKWVTPVINSNKCKISISTGVYSDESGAFVINEQPIVTLSPDQCPGSVSISWTNVPDADKYYMMIKKGPYLQKVDSVGPGILNYTFTGLNSNTDCFVSVLPSFRGREGFRSKAIMRRPDDGSCAMAKNGDLALEAIVFPESGRRYTSSALKTNSWIAVRLRNQDNDPAPDYSIAYKINSGSWKTSRSLSTAADTVLLQYVDPEDFSALGSYTLTVAVKNNAFTDPEPKNDTLVKVFRLIANDPLLLTGTHKNDFESLPDLTLLHDTTGLDVPGYWDYTNSSDTGRLRTRIPGSPLVKTGRSVSMDVNLNTSKNMNYFTGTFNLGAYNVATDEVRFDFEYEMRGNPAIKDSNRVWVRGSDLDPWIPAFEYDAETDTMKLHESGSISFRELFRKNGQSFSSSTQIRFGQYDTTVIVDDHFGAGLTIDNVNLYKVNKDLQLTAILAPAKSNCDIAESALTVSIRNSTINPMSGITLAYILDGKSVVTETFPGTIDGDKTITYTFATGLSGLSQGAHTLKVWLSSPGDDLLKNDTIDGYNFYIAPLINTFPYLEDFETSDGNWYTGGRNVSWAYGVISGGHKINRAASGVKAWKTSLSGSHKSNELSYLISPCINTSTLVNPILSFSTAFEIEKCDVTLCDRAYVEYSTDNEQSWKKLGASGSGTNWYNENKNQVWVGDWSRWHVASVSLPKATQLKLRFVLGSDQGANLEGLAVDDIHIFDLQQKIAFLSGQEQKIAEQAAIAGTSWFYFLDNTEVLLAVNPHGNTFGTVNAAAFGHIDIADPARRQFFAPRSWLVNTKQDNNKDAAVQLFLTEDEANRLWADTTCASCNRGPDIYRCGITRYTSGNSRNEDSSLANNAAGTYSFIPYNEVKWVPYDNGYYAQFSSPAQGEFWLNNGGILGTLPLNTEYVQFQAIKMNEQEARISWESIIDTAMKEYVLERSADSLNFSSITTVTAKHSVSAQYSYIDKPGIGEGEKVFYRLFCTAENSKTFYSGIEPVEWTKADQLLSVYPIPSANGDLTLKWTGIIGASADLVLTDVQGKTILQTRLNSENWPNTHVLHLSHLSKGVYYLRFYTGNSKYTKKVVFK